MGHVESVNDEGLEEVKRKKLEKSFENSRRKEVRK